MPGKRRLSLKDFKSQARDGDPGECLVAKGYSCEVEKASGDLEGERRLLFTTSTGCVDRMGDTVNPDGCTNLKSFHKTGVVLWAHDSSLPPIAKPIKAWSEDGKVKSVAEFMPADMDHPLGRGFGATVYRYFTEKFMKSVSIGFAPLEWKWADEDENRNYGIDFLKWEKLEFSAVPIPANREAVVELAHKGVDMRGVFDWATRCLDGGAELIVPRDLIEDAHKGLAEVYGDNPTICIPSVASPKGAIGYGAAHQGGTPVADKDDKWDGPREVAEADVDDLGVMCAWKEDDAENKGDYKLPHHRAGDDHAVVWRGVTAAMGALLGARGGVDIPDDDKKGVYGHLAKHYRDDFDEEPPEFREYRDSEVAAALELLCRAEAIEQIEREVEELSARTKAGRVLSKKNEKDLRNARDLVDAVLEQVAAEEVEEQSATPEQVAAELCQIVSGDIEATPELRRLIVAAAETIATNTNPTQEPTTREPTDEEIRRALPEIVREAVNDNWRNFSGELP